MPESSNKPVPVLVSAIDPAPFPIVPEKIVEVLSPPAVSVAAPPLLVRVPAPASEPMAFEKPATSSTALLATVTAELLPKALVEPACKVPASTTVGPV